MSGHVVAEILLSMVSLGLLGWVLYLRRRPAPLPPPASPSLPPSPAPDPVYIDRPVIEERIVVQERVVYADPVEPDLAIGPMEYLAEPQALPDVPDAVHDSILDGARLGGLVVRGAAVRGDLARREARLRRQAISIALLNQFNPPVLLSTIATGLAGAERSQVGAAQVCRSAQIKVADRARELDAAWRNGAGEEIGALLREVAAALADALTLAARHRNQPESALATEVTCVLSRLGDMPARQHLAFGVGAAPVLRLSPEKGFEELFRPAPAPSGRSLLPQTPTAVSWQAFESQAGEVIVACTASTAEFLRREQVRDRIVPLWSQEEPPGFAAFLAQLGMTHPAYREDRAAVGLWDGRSRKQ
ncbi:protein phosphatase 2C domain-containing protein [Dactylosporangium sp. NPDC005572]|uniref:protein phosphatase 2C domain-containing protein n=1 Tax=Dactylosporangium sp. NPDC005572 TaxID=3156889 RepID=UPI0033B2DC48